MLQITNHKPGDNITLMNTLFFRGIDPDDDKFKEYATIIYKDKDTGLKYKEEIVNPDYEYYIVKSDKRVNYNRLFIDEKDVDLHVVAYRHLEKDIAKNLGLTNFYFENIKNGNKSENRLLHRHPDIFNSDMNIEDHLRFRFKMDYKDDIVPITKSYFDIEVDGIDVPNHAVPMDGEAPVNAITIVLQEQKSIYTLLLKTKKNPQIAEFEAQVANGSIFKEVNSFIRNAVGEAIADKYDINFNYNFLFYEEEEEISLIADLFKIINTFKPDFALAWNMAYDIPYLINRIIRLGYDPVEIICHPDFENKICRYIVDERMKNEYAERGDYAQISSYTVYLDQMIHFASRRKGQSAFKSHSLDYIGEKVARVRKLDYKDITTDIAELPYKSYKTFVFYNIIDTIVQYSIERVTGDMEYVFGKTNQNNTRYSKVHRQTRYLTNRGVWEFRKDGFIMGNNVNAFNTKPDEKFPGAFVADPAKVNSYSRLRIFGKVVDVFNNCDDFD